MITRVSKVIVPVVDQQAALDFWTRCMEFTIVRDDSYGDERWIEVKPPNQDLLLVLSLHRPDEPPRTVPDRLPHSDLFFDCADIEQTHRQLSRRGVQFPLPPSNQQFGWWALFEDNEGSRYALGQWDDQQPQTPDPALRRLDFLVGTRKVEGETAPDFTGPARFTLIENESTNDWELRDDDGESRPWRHTTMTRVGETDGGQA
jgi:predicted enzyme related to lactoylglutathione lyase